MSSKKKKITCKDCKRQKGCRNQRYRVRAEDGYYCCLFQFKQSGEAFEKRMCEIRKEITNTFGIKGSIIGKVNTDSGAKTKLKLSQRK